MQRMIGNKSVQRVLSQYGTLPSHASRFSLRRTPEVGWHGRGGALTTGLNASVQTVEGTRRIPIRGLSLGNRSNDSGTETGRRDRNQNPIQVDGRNQRVSDITSEQANEQQAIVIIPNGIDLSQEIDILLHLHGHNVGYRAESGRRRDIDIDRIEQQLRDSRRNMIAVLPQGSFGPSSGIPSFGGVNRTTFITEIFNYLTSNSLWPSPSGATPSTSSTSTTPVAPPTVRQGQMTLSGHSGGGFPLADMLDSDYAARNQAGSNPANPTQMEGLILFDTIHNASRDNREANRVIRWLVEQMNHDLQELQGIANRTSDPVRTQEQLAYLSRSVRFRGYYSRGYAANYRPVTEALDAWFNQGQQRRPSIQLSTVMSSAVLAQLRDNYRTVGVGHSDHSHILGQGNRLQEGLTRSSLAASITSGSTTGSQGAAPQGNVLPDAGALDASTAR